MGTVRKVIVEYLQDFLMVPHEKLGQKQAGVAARPGAVGPRRHLGDVGTHCVNLLEYVTGDPIVELCADRSTFLPDRKLDEDVNTLLRFKGGGKGVLTISQVATGEENGLTLRVYGSEGAILWAQENPNYLELYRYGEPRQTLTRGPGLPLGRRQGLPRASRPATPKATWKRSPRSMAASSGPSARTSTASRCDRRVRIPHRLRRPSRHAVHHPRDRILQRRLTLGGAGLKRNIAGVPVGTPSSFSIDQVLRLKCPLVIDARALDLVAGAYLWHGHVPPMAAQLGRRLRIGFDDQNGGPIVRLGGGNRMLKLGDRGDLVCDRAQARGVGCEVDYGQRLVAGVFQQVIEASTAGRGLQAIDAAEAGIVEYDDRQLEPEHD